ncbi:hypothetical protein BS17DRAFT_720923 [Gyrodon lividus]|nr:hypothetical protein BS17DRAFT_720923 [Gyrodon lividus]
MTCGGCSGAVERALSKVEGITYEVSLENQEVKVITESVSYDTVLEKIKKTGKEVGAILSGCFAGLRTWWMLTMSWSRQVISGREVV